MANHPFTPIFGKRIRVTPLTNGGVAAGAKSIVTDGFITVSLSSETEDGAEIIQKNASGAFCVNEKLPNSFKRFNVELELCGINPELLVRITNAETYEDAAGDAAGITVGEGEITKEFALEVWTGLSGISAEADAQAATDDALGYFLLPRISAGVLGDISVGNESAVNAKLTGAVTKGGNRWGTGPFEVVKTAEGAPSKLPTAIDDGDHLLILDTALAAPPAALDPVAVPAA